MNPFVQTGTCSLHMLHYLLKQIGTLPARFADRQTSLSILCRLLTRARNLPGIQSLASKREPFLSIRHGNGFSKNALTLGYIGSTARVLFKLRSGAYFIAIIHTPISKRLECITPTNHSPFDCMLPRRSAVSR